MRNLIRSGVTAIALLCLLSLGRQAQACSCRPSSVEEQLATAAHVALVEIRDVQQLDEHPQQRARFTVLRSFKGGMDAVADLRSGAGGGDCGVPLRAGRRYLVYLAQDSNLVGICYGVWGPVRQPSAGQHEGDHALAAFLASLATHLQQGTPLAELPDALFENPFSRGGPPPPPPPPPEN